jgi:hypothetical protein
MYLVRRNSVFLERARGARWGGLYLPTMALETDTFTPRRNFRLGVINGLLFTLAETLLDPTLALAAYVSQLISPGNRPKVGGGF